LEDDVVFGSDTGDEQHSVPLTRELSGSPQLTFTNTPSQFSSTSKIKERKNFTANNPIPSPVAKDKKNPLVHSTKNISANSKNDLIKILSDRNTELYALNKEKQEL
jgi:hypothetical protein